MNTHPFHINLPKKTFLYTTETRQKRQVKGSTDQVRQV